MSYMGLSDYERRELERLLKHRERRLARPSRNVVPKRVRERMAAAAERATTRAKDLPGAEQVQQGYAAAAKGLGKAVHAGGSATVSTQRALRRYRRAGVEVDALEDLHAVDLQEIDRIAPFSRIRKSHAATLFVEGGVAGAAITGGTAAAATGGVAGIGAGAAPGLGWVAATTAGDAAAVLVGCSRVAAETALYYGYDPRRPKEVFLMSVIGLGMASSQVGKMAAYGELARLTQLLARQAPWIALNQQVMTKVVQRFAAQFGQRLTKKKLSQFVPVAGIAVGAGLNYWVVDQTAEAAYEAYRERYLRDKVGGDGLVEDGPVAPSGAGDGQDDDVISVLRILEETGALSSDDDSDEGMRAERKP
jgi:hypothetical protein